jgi:hypothetical protein
MPQAPIGARIPYGQKIVAEETGIRVMQLSLTDQEADYARITAHLYITFSNSE